MNEWQKPDIGRHYLSIIIGVLVLVLFGWLYHDIHRNDGINHDTDGTMADLEKRIQSAEQRLDGMSKRIDANQKTIESVARGISTSTGLVIEITEGTDRAEKRLESAIGRTERIQAIIDGIEAKNK